VKWRWGWAAPGPILRFWTSIRRAPRLGPPQFAGLGGRAIGIPSDSHQQIGSSGRIGPHRRRTWPHRHPDQRRRHHSGTPFLEIAEEEWHRILNVT